MNPIYTSDATALSVFRRAFPRTNFRSLAVYEFRGPKNLNSYWDSGYRDYFAIVPLVGNGPIKQIEQNGTPFDDKNYELSELPEGYALAVHHYSGTRQSGTLYLSKENITPMLPAPVELSRDEKAVLIITRSLISRARDEERARWGMSAAQWDAARSSLTSRGLLLKSGAITNEGRNLAIGLGDTYKGQRDYQAATTN